MTDHQPRAGAFDPGPLLLVDDDPTFLEVLGAALVRRGFDVRTAASVEEAEGVLRGFSPRFAVIDLSLPGASGLTLVERLAERRPVVRTVVLTGYASIATAVAAIKLGAVHYLTKPADAAEIVRAFTHDAGTAEVPIATEPVSVRRLAWEHIQKVLGDCGGNVSEAARRLGMHRRTLQRKLRKRPVRR